jgi:hypothetical protein
MSISVLETKESLMEWVSLLIAAINAAPAISRAIEISKMPPLPPEHMAQLRQAMDNALARLDAEIEAKEKA